MFFMWYVLTLNVVSLFTEIDSELVATDPLGGILSIFFWIVLTLWIYSGLSGIWSEFAVSGFYISSTHFIKVLSYPFYLKVKKQPLSRVVTIEVLKNPDTDHHILKAIFCITKFRDLKLMTWFNHSVSVVPPRYEYFPKEQGEMSSFIWGEDIETEGNMTVEELQAVAQQGKELLVKYTYKPIEFFYPQLHCRNCDTLNSLDAMKCESCGSEINHDFGNVPTFD
jgi:hypothetical protein